MATFVVFSVPCSRLKISGNSTTWLIVNKITYNDASKNKAILHPAGDKGSVPLAPEVLGRGNSARSTTFEVDVLFIVAYARLQTGMQLVSITARGLLISAGRYTLEEMFPGSR